MNKKDEFYVHEAFARKMANRRFMAGMFWGMAITWTLPFFKVVKTGIEKAIEKHKNEEKETTVDDCVVDISEVR